MFIAIYHSQPFVSRQCPALIEDFLQLFYFFDSRKTMRINIISAIITGIIIVI